MQQEAILTAKTYMGTILSYPWDGGSIVTDAVGNPKVIVLSTDNADFRNGNDPQRKGHIDQPRRRTMMQNASGNLIEAIAGLPVNPLYRSINNYKSGHEDLVVTVDDSDSVVRINLGASLQYVSDAANYAASNVNFDFKDESAVGPGGPTNIKMLIVTADLPDYPTALQIRLRAYTSNIGELELWSN
jgi:hypothetical protein